MKVKDYSLV